MKITNRKLIDNFFTSVRITGELSNSSILKYTDSINKFLFVIGDKYIGDLELHDFDEFILTMKDNGASSSRIANVISAVKRLLTFLQSENLIKKHLDLERIKKPKITRKDVEYLSEEEIKLLLDTIKKDIAARPKIRKTRMMALVMLLLQTGARIGEALSIKTKDIDRINMEIPIVGKGGKQRNLYVSKNTLYWVDRYILERNSSHEYLFLQQNGKSRWMQTDVGRSFRRYRSLSGITKHFVLHTLRHTTATQLCLKGAQMNCIQHILGHTRLETTIKYYIGAAEKHMAKKMMQDEQFNFIPKDSLPSVT